MSPSDRSIRVIPFAVALTLLVGCGGAAEDELAMAASADMPSPTAISSGFVLPPSGTTGTPADNVTDPALRMLPNPNPTVITHWAKLPDGREWGSTAGADIGPDGHVWAYDRCGSGSAGGPGVNCDNNPVDPIVKYHKDTGELLAAFGAGLFVTPHGIHVDDDGNVWVTDFAGNEAGTKGHQVIKFSPEGEVLMRLGEAGVPGSGPGQLNQPNDVITTPEGIIFVADGHNGQGPDPAPGSTGRILKFTADGEFLLQIGRAGQSGGSSDTENLGRPAGIVVDPAANEVYIADGYGNRRVIVFDADTGAYKRHWGAYGEPPDDTPLPPYDPTGEPSRHYRSPVHDVAIARDGLVYVADRTNNRVQVFQKDGEFVRETLVRPDTLGSGSVSGVTLSEDAEQRWLFIPDGTNNVVWVLERTTLEVVDRFGRLGKNAGQFYRLHNLAIDSRGNLYTTEVNVGQRLQKFDRLGGRTGWTQAAITGRLCLGK